MAVTTDQYNRMLSRITSLEQHVNDLSVALDRMITLEQMNQLQVILQTDIDDMQTQIDALETRVTGLEEEPIL
jgi:tetrahydromethanopterin S-methyltransferase subunit B